MACSVCGKKGHDIRACPVNAESEKVKLELALTQRRYLLESINTITELLKVPMVSAGVWFALSRSNPTLGVLNKAILAAELSPIIGDITFPEGVLLGAAIESTEDMVNILNKEGIMKETWEKLYEEFEKVAIPFGDILVPFFTPESMKNKSCAELGKRVWEMHLLATGQMEGPEGVIPDPRPDPLGARKAAATVAFGFNLKAMKDNGCPRPTHPYLSPEAQWEAL